MRYDLAYRQNGNVRIFYGVTEEGIDDDWRVAIQTATGKPVEAATA